MGLALTLWGDTGEVLPSLEYVCHDNSWLKCRSAHLSCLFMPCAPPIVYGRNQLTNHI